MICDASYSTYFLTHWARDRKAGRFTVAEAVRELTSVPARVAGFALDLTQGGPDEADADFRDYA